MTPVYYSLFSISIICPIDWVSLMFNKVISGNALPKRLSSDNDPLFQYHRWQANLRILGIEEIKSVPYVPVSHPFIERLIQSIRHELLDQTLFRNADDLQNKLDAYKEYFNCSRSHMALNAETPKQKRGSTKNVISLSNYSWQKHLSGLVKLPKSA